MGKNSGNCTVLLLDSITVFLRSSKQLLVPIQSQTFGSYDLYFLDYVFIYFADTVVLCLFFLFLSI